MFLKILAGPDIRSLDREEDFAFFGGDLFHHEVGHDTTYARPNDLHRKRTLGRQMNILSQFQIFEHVFCLDEGVIAKGCEVEVCEWVAGKKIGANHLDKGFNLEVVSEHCCHGGEEC